MNIEKYTVIVERMQTGQLALCDQFVRANKAIGDFVDEHPTIKILALSFLISGSLKSSSGHKVLGYGIHIPGNVFPGNLGRSYGLLDDTHKFFTDVS